MDADRGLGLRSGTGREDLGRGLDLHYDIGRDSGSYPDTGLPLTHEILNEGK